jgi:nitrate reductase gamma subunit
LEEESKLDAWIEFGRGPLFRFAFVVAALGLARLLALAVAGGLEVWRNSPDRRLPWKDIVTNTLGWLAPVARLWSRRPVYSTVSCAFHVGLLLVPFALAAHVTLWKRALGFAWPAIPQPLADWLTLTVIAAGAGLALMRAAPKGARALSRFQDYAILLLLTTPFFTGYLCSNADLGSGTYRAIFLCHVYSGDLVLLLLPFTRLAHCVLAPLSQLAGALSWKLAPGAGDRVAETLGYANRPSWVEGARLTAGVRKEA